MIEYLAAVVSTKLAPVLRLKRDARAVTALEYGLIAALIAVVIITAVTSLGTSPKRRIQQGCVVSIGKVSWADFAVGQFGGISAVFNYRTGRHSLAIASNKEPAAIAGRDRFFNCGWLFRVGVCRVA